MDHFFNNFHNIASIQLFFISLKPALSLVLGMGKLAASSGGAKGPRRVQLPILKSNPDYRDPKEVLFCPKGGQCKSGCTNFPDPDNNNILITSNCHLMNLSRTDRQ